MMTNDHPHSMESKSDALEERGAVLSEFKAAEGGIIEGYASIFGNIDQGNDVVEAGAYTASLASRKQIKMLWQHKPDEVIGVWEEVKEDSRGLRVKGRLLLDVEKGREAHALIKAGALDGLSIGYRTISARKEFREEKQVRVLQRVDLWEVSLVTFPMDPAAKLDVKAAVALSQKEFGRRLGEGFPMSRRVADALMRDGWKGVQALSDSGDGDYSELLEAVEASSLMNSLS